MHKYDAEIGVRLGKDDYDTDIACDEREFETDEEAIEYYSKTYRTLYKIYKEGDNGKWEALERPYHRVYHRV